MRAVQIALRVLDTVSRRQPVGVSELARELQLSKTTVQRSLLSLSQAGWIEPAHEQKTAWTLSVRALVVGGRAIDSRRGLRSIAIPIMETLRRATEETIHLFVRDGDWVVLIERLDGIKPVRMFNPVGGFAWMHRTSSGKSILANLPQAECDQYLARPLTTGQPRAALDVTAFLDELALIRERGFAINLSANQPDVSAVSAAIFDANRQPIGAISISGPSDRISESLCIERGPLVSDAARQATMGMRLRR